MGVPRITSEVDDFPHRRGRMFFLLPFICDLADFAALKLSTRLISSASSYLPTRLRHGHAPNLYTGHWNLKGALDCLIRNLNSACAQTAPRNLFQMPGLIM
jgi:hypothetical protein